MTSPTTSEQERLIAEILDIIDNSYSRRYEIAVRIAEWHTRALQDVLDKIGEPSLGGLTIKAASYDDVVKAIRWYKERISQLTAEQSGGEG